MTDWEETLRALREQFIRGSADRLARLASSLARVERNAKDVEALRELRMELHGLSGLGGTYGFPKVTQLGFEGESRCDALLSSETDPGEADIALWISLLAGLRAEFESLQPEGSVSPPPSGPPAPRVLVVEDDPDEWSFLQSVLEPAGYEILRTNFAQLEATRAIFHPDLLVADVTPFAGSDRELPGLLASESETIKVPVLFLSSVGSEIGPVACLVKPVTPGLLLATVAARIELGRAASKAEKR